jgi:hypothetical protein
VPSAAAVTAAAVLIVVVDDDVDDNVIVVVVDDCGVIIDMLTLANAKPVRGATANGVQL